MKKFCPLLTVLALAGCGTLTNPNSPDASGDATTAAVVYSAIGASDANGVGSSYPCVPYTDCPEGKSYVQGIVNRYKGAGRQVTLQNLGVAGATLSPGFQTIANQLNRGSLVNFLSDEMPFVKTDATLVTVFAGGNDANAIGDGAKAGFGGGATTSWINNQISNFGRDMTALVSGIRGRAPKAKIVILNLPNLAGLPYLNGNTLGEKQMMQSISVQMTQQINALTAQGAVVVDLMCDARAYDRNIYSGDGFHPNDTGYSLFADVLYAAATSSAPATPRASCAQMVLY